jgi:hypothetical protein
MADIRTPRTDKATSCCAVHATVMNTLRQYAPKEAKELAKAQAQVRLAQRGPLTLTLTLSVEVNRLKLAEQRRHQVEFDSLPGQQAVAPTLPVEFNRLKLVEQQVYPGQIMI